MFLTVASEAGSWVFLILYFIILIAVIAAGIALFKYITRNTLEININIKRKNKKKN